MAHETWSNWRIHNWCRGLIFACVVVLSAAQAADAGRSLGHRPRNGSILAQKTSGMHQLIVENGRDVDALVKLRDHSGRTVLCFYVRSGEQAQIDTIPSGNYNIEFACGRGFSRRTGLFSQDLRAMKFPVINTFVTEYKNSLIYKTSIACTLHEVDAGNVGAVPINANDFLQD